MKLFAMAFVMTVATGVVGAVSAEGIDDRKLQGRALHTAVAGKTVRLATPLGALPIRFRNDGTMLGTAGELVAYTGSAHDSGRWWVAAEKLCQRWHTWLDGKTYCFTLRQQGQTVHWVRNDGMSGRATITR